MEATTMPNELIPFNDVELPIYPIVGYERGLPIVECQRRSATLLYNATGTGWQFNCPFCGETHTHPVGDFKGGVTARPRQRVRGECKEPDSPFHFKEYYIREEGDEENGKWDKYVQLADSHRSRRSVYKKENLGIALFGSYCLVFDDPNAVTTNLELGRAWQAFREQKKFSEELAAHWVKFPLTLDLQTGAIMPQESNHAFSRKFHATFPQLRRKRLRDGVTRQCAFVGVQVDWLKLGRI
jgi:hypothetical protein